MILENREFVRTSLAPCRATTLVALASAMLFALCLITPAASGRRMAKGSPSRMVRGARAQVERKLGSLGYWVGPGETEMRDAVVAFQKAEGLPPTGRLTPADVRSITQASAIKPRESNYFHVEVDLGRQILFVVDQNGTVSNIMPISTGSGREFTSEGWTRDAVTPTGRFRIFQKFDGWHRSPLGRLYFPNYIVGGVAIHGFPLVPTHAASHGCIRIPMFAAKQFSEMTPLGTVVLVYGEGPKPEDTTSKDSEGISLAKGTNQRL